jgi:hypothetical protein
MGKKISWEDAEKLGRLKAEDDSIILPPNKYGYRVNISHPKVRPLYEKFKRKRKAMILSDQERFAFELIVHKLLQEGRI